MSIARRKPGSVRDALITALREQPNGATVAELVKTITVPLSGSVASSSVRSYLSLNTPGTFERVSRGRYKLKGAK